MAKLEAQEVFKAANAKMESLKNSIALYNQRLLTEQSKTGHLFR